MKSLYIWTFTFERMGGRCCAGAARSAAARSAVGCSVEHPRATCVFYWFFQWFCKVPSRGSRGGGAAAAQGTCARFASSDPPAHPQQTYRIKENISINRLSEPGLGFPMTSKKPYGSRYPWSWEPRPWIPAPRPGWPRGRQGRTKVVKKSETVNYEASATKRARKACLRLSMGWGA